MANKKFTLKILQSINRFYPKKHTSIPNIVEKNQIYPQEKVFFKILENKF